MSLHPYSTAGLNWGFQGAYSHIAQLMFSFQLGGVVYSHNVEKGSATRLEIAVGAVQAQKPGLKMKARGFKV